METAAAAVYGPVMLFLGGLMVVAGAGAFCGNGAGGGDDPRPGATASAMRRNVTIGAAVVSAAACFVLWFGPVLGTGDRTPIRQVLIYRDEANVLRDFSVPGFERFGLASAGMFGLLPRHMASWGFEAVMMEPGAAIDAESLGQYGALVVINLTSHFLEAEKRAIYAFVEGGGGLLVLGDHTDISGSMGPLNDLLSPVGIRFRFDSAFTPTRWVNAYETFGHPITRGLDAANERLRHSTGASLDIDPSVRPVVSARWGFSDWGSYEAADNGFLGDYAYQFDERLGDVVVIAEARHGAGRVLVFGDTSAFQNNAVFHSDGFLRRTFDYMISGGGWPRSVGAGAACVLLAAVVSAMVFLRGSRRLGAAICVLSLPVMGASLASGVVGRGREPVSKTSPWPIAYVEAAHANRFSLGPWQDKSIGGLLLNLARNGYVAKVVHDGLGDLGGAARVLVVTAPTEPFTAGEVAAVHSFMSEGGLLVLSAGYEERSGSVGLLKMLEVEIGAEPLGPIPVEPPVRAREIIGELLTEPHFREAWPVRSTSAEPLESFFRQGLYDVIGFRAVGRGGALVIGDSWFLLDKTLEAEKAYWKGNIELLKGMFEELGGRGIGR